MWLQAFDDLFSAVHRMKQTQIRAVALVREIRDAQANELGKKSQAEIVEFFNRAGERAKRSLRSVKRGSTPTRRITSR
jgi:hypothetical protein